MVLLSNLNDRLNMTYPLELNTDVLVYFFLLTCAYGFIFSAAPSDHPAEFILYLPSFKIYIYIYNQNAPLHRYLL